jgi:hypothetical protein
LRWTQTKDPVWRTPQPYGRETSAKWPTESSSQQTNTGVPSRSEKKYLGLPGQQTARSPVGSATSDVGAALALVESVWVEVADN